MDTWVSGEYVTLLKADKNDAVLFTLAPIVIPTSIYDAAYQDFRGAAHKRPTRALASGLTAERQVKRNGQLSTSTRIDPRHPRLAVARDGVLGSLESTRNKAEFCRQPIDVRGCPAALAYMQFCSGVYDEFAPAHYLAQCAAVSQVNPEWPVPGTVFTTATANWCFNTYPHIDGKDYKQGLGVITSHYVGGPSAVWIIFIKHRVAFPVEDRGVLLGDVGNELHGSPATPPHDGYGTKSGRLAWIFYYRPGLAACGTAQQESSRRDRDRVRRRSK